VTGQRTLRGPAPWLLAVPMSIALSWTLISPAPSSSQEIPDEDLLALSGRQANQRQQRGLV